MATLTGPNGGYYTDGWYTTTNAWGSSGWRYGIDYTITGTYDPANITKNVSYNWNFGALPSNPNDYEILAYPSINYGQDPWETTIDPNERPFPLKIADITKFEASYDISFGGQTQGYNIAFDMFVSSSPTGGRNAITDEIMVWVHTGGFTPGVAIAQYTDGKGNSGGIYNFYMDAFNWEYTAFLTNEETPAGTIDVAGILKKLTSMGIVGANEYVEKIDIGAEIGAGQGWMTFNNVGYTIQMAGQSEVVLGTPSLTAPPPPPPPPPPPGTTTKALQPDFNQDGKADILFKNSQNGYAYIWTMDGTKCLSTATVGKVGTSTNVICAADFDGNGSSDLLLQYSSGQPQIWFMDGTNLDDVLNAGTGPGSSWKVITAGDFNADGKADILWQNMSSGQAMVWLMNGSSVLSSATLGASPGTSWKVMGAGDFNGDGMSDVVLRNGSDGKIQVWLMNGSTVTSKTTLSNNPGTRLNVIGTGDFNGDDKSDILLQKTDGTIRVFQMDGTKVLSAANVGTNPGSGWKAIGAEDMNGDGKDDILFQNSSGQVMAWLMNGFSVQSQGLVGSPGSSWHAVVGG